MIWGIEAWQIKYVISMIIMAIQRFKLISLRFAPCIFLTKGKSYRDKTLTNIIELFNYIGISSRFSVDYQIIINSYIIPANLGWGSCCLQCCPSHCTRCRSCYHSPNLKACKFIHEYISWILTFVCSFWKLGWRFGCADIQIERE